MDPNHPLQKLEVIFTNDVLMNKDGQNNFWKHLNEVKGIWTAVKRLFIYKVCVRFRMGMFK